MDQELVAYLEESRQEMREQIGGLRQETRQRFEQMEGQITALREENRQRFEQMEGQVTALREENRQRFEQLEGRVGEQCEGLREEIRHTQILVEGGRGETRLLAEGMMGLNHRMGTSQTEIHLKLDDLRTLVTPLYRRIDERVSHLEAREEEKTRDVMEVIRERYGTPQVR